MAAVLPVLMQCESLFQLSAFPLLGLVIVLLSVAIIDWNTMTIPDGLLIFGTASAIIWIMLGNISWQNALLGAAAGGLPLFLIDRLIWLFANKPGFGFGDVKLMAMSGLFIGWQGVQTAYFVAFIAGGAFGVWLLFTKRAERGAYIAFGPFLCSGVLAAILMN